MAFCVQCGSKQQVSGNFCYDCGAKIVRPDSPPRTKNQLNTPIKTSAVPENIDETAKPISVIDEPAEARSDTQNKMGRSQTPQNVVAGIIFLAAGLVAFDAVRINAQAKSFTTEINDFARQIRTGDLKKFEETIAAAQKLSADKINIIIEDDIKKALKSDTIENRRALYQNDMPVAFRGNSGPSKPVIISGKMQCNTILPAALIGSCNALEDSPELKHLLIFENEPFPSK